MTYIGKVRCDACGLDENLPLNHVFTVRLPGGATNYICVYQGAFFLREEERDPGDKVWHVCGIECLQRALARWASGAPLGGPAPANPPEGVS